jgi:hypothetical protein
VISSSTYRGAVELRRDLLAAYSALDHRTTSELSPGQVEGAFRRLLARLSVLLYQHGATVPGQFLQALRRVWENDLDLTDPVGLTASFLESGRSAGIDISTYSELQQELVHFSRIVDIGTLGLGDPNALRAVRRIRNSRRLPDSLKVLSELIIVTRSRMLQRGAELPVPYPRPHPAAERELDGHSTLWIPDEDDYLLLVASPRRRTRREIAYLFTSLLNYLIPIEAVLAVWAHAVNEKAGVWLDVTLISIAPDKRISTVRWSRPGGSDSQIRVEPITWCLDSLPVVEVLDSPKLARKIATRSMAVTVEQTVDQIRVTITDDKQSEYPTTLVPPSTDATVSVTDMAARIDSLVRSYDGPDVVSIECGHIHLDRELDLDQEVGLDLGARAVAVLEQRQTTSPTLTPMMDDDHVLVKLRPSDYRIFLNRHLSGKSMHLIPESSPIIRSIVCAMWTRLELLGLRGRCQERGGNIFLKLDDGNYCELFEDFRGEGITGCVLFECALLVYRSSAKQFDDYFRTRFALAENVHDTASRILDQSGSHDDRRIQLQAFYAAFSDVTDPRRTDCEVVALVDEVIERAYPGIAHLNVLEDYYEVQQGKVRTLIELLELPMRLVTIHFNARTGRVVLDG